MPRIDPIQLLNCLGVLLSPNGGIKSTEEVQRLANLMTKFSKKLVSKCIYIQILKCTDTELLGLFMGSGGWRLVHTWLTESIVSKNWPLVKELLELLLLCPVDIERLKTNNCPKLVKELSKDGNHFAIRALASKLVEQWLKTVKGEIVIPIKLIDIPLLITEDQLVTSCDGLIKSKTTCVDQKLDVESKSTTDSTTHVIQETELNINIEECDSKIKDELDKGPETLPVLKISVKDGKQTVTHIDDAEKSSDDTKKMKESPKGRDKSHAKKSSSSSSKHSSKSHSSSSSDKKSSSSSKSSSHSSSSSSRHSSKDKSKDKDKHSSKSKPDGGSKSSSEKSSSSGKSKGDKPKSDKDKLKDKSRDEKNNKNTESSKSSSKKTEDKSSTKKTEDKLSSKKTEDKTPSIHKLGKIPKISDVKKDKPSISIEVRKPDEPKPKTVKTFHSKFRKHGLEEEVKPPPSRAALLNKKPPAPLPPIIVTPKRPSPVHNETPPEKKAKTTDVAEKPGSIKLIPPKPKPMMLLESDMFMDALNASATNKKEPRKRKRRTSGSKDCGPANESSPPHTPTISPAEKSVPPKFYQDTLETDNKDKSNSSADKIENDKEPEEEATAAEPHTLTINGLKGVLCYHKRKGPKKSIKWKPEPELEEVQYFELDETERVNVTKSSFTDMKHLERIHEREAFQKARNLSTVDVMEERTAWRPLIPVDTDGQTIVEYGKNSKEKEIQAIRQKGTLQPLYFHKSMIPDSPLEAEPETHPYTEPTIIPLDDVTNTDNVSDYRNTPWPEPKGNAPPSSASNVNMPMFPPGMNQFPGGFPPAQFPGMPGFQAPPMIPPADWQANMMMANGMPPAAMGAMPPGMMVPPDNMMMTPDMFGAPNPMYPVGPDGFMPPNMFPMDFNMAAAQGAPGGAGFGGPGGFRAGGGNANWRGKGWDGPPGPQRGRGGPSRGGRKAVVCSYFQRKGSCRQGDKCTFLHPGVNCPY